MPRGTELDPESQKTPQDANGGMNGIGSANKSLRLGGCQRWRESVFGSAERSWYGHVKAFIYSFPG